jgi:flagellar hook-associated protein 2
MHLVLTGEDQGGAYQITFNPGGGTTLDGSGDTEDFTAAAGVFTETLTARNAQIRIDGYPPGAWIERTTNHITDAIEGITLELAGPGASNVTVSTDTDAILEKVLAFKEAFNSVRAAIKEATAYNSNTGEAGSLLGNYAVQIVQSKLDNLLSGSAPGFRSPDETYVTLQQLGFSTDALEGSGTEGLLLLDTTVLTSALESDPDAVAAVFSAYLAGTSSDSRIAFRSALPSTTPGIYDIEVDLDPLSANYRKGRFRPAGEDWHPWVDLTGTSGNYTLTGTSGYGERGLALNISYTDGALHTSEVRLKNGVVTELSFSMEDFLGSSGPLETLTSNYNEIIDHIDLRIAKEERRLDQYEELLRKRFDRLDSYMNQMNSLGAYLSQWTAQSSK